MTRSALIVGRSRPRRQVAAPVAAGAAALEGAALAVLVALGGSALWGAVRVLVVLAVAVLVSFCALRAGRGVAGLAALVAGIVGTAAGAGIGVPHLIDVGAGLQSIAGLLALGAGLVLLVCGAMLLLGLLPGWWRLVAIPGTILLLLLLFPLTLAVAATNVPPDRPGTETPADLGLSYVDVDLRTSDGIALSAWYVPSHNGAAVVLLHGAGSNSSSTLGHAAVLAGHGFGVLLLDTRGHGRSGGHAMDFGWYGDLDIDAAVTYLEQRPDVMQGRIAAVGLSMGGEEALGAAASDPRIMAVVAEGATNRTLADRAWLPRHLGGWIQRRMDWVMFGVADRLTGAEPPIGLRSAVIAISPRPVLLIAAGLKPDEVTAARYYQDASRGNVQVWEVPASPHTGALSTHPAEWEDSVIRFLDDALHPFLVT